MNEASGKDTSQILREVRHILFPKEHQVRWLHHTKNSGCDALTVNDKPCRPTDNWAHLFTLDGALYRVLAPTHSYTNPTDYYGVTNTVCKAISRLFYKNKDWKQIFIGTWETQSRRTAKDIRKVLDLAIEIAERAEKEIENDVKE
jgi:hypothetical protein